MGGKAGDPFAAVTGVTALQSRWHHGKVYTLFSYELAKESGEAPADLLNPAPQCFSDTFLLNAAAVRTHFCCFSVPGTTVLPPLGTLAPLCHSGRKTL